MRLNLKNLVWGLDIGGVISKYPNEFVQIVRMLIRDDYGCPDPGNVYFISDMHPKEEIIKTLRDNDFDFPNLEQYVYSADYSKYGNLCKSVLIKQLGIDIFIDDFDGYLQWDSSLGPQPILLKVMPDAFKPYWHETWVCNGGDFGRKRYTDIGVG